MFQNKIYLLLFIVLSLVAGCKKTIKETGNISGISNEIQYAKVFEMYDFENFKILKITQPWQGAAEMSVYVLANDVNNIPDSLAHLTKVQIPVKSIVVTSTTHIP